MATHHSSSAAVAAIERALVIRRKGGPPPPPPPPKSPMRWFLLVVPIGAILAGLVAGAYRGVFIGLLMIPYGAFVGALLLLGAFIAMGESRSVVRGVVGVLIAAALLGAIGSCRAKYGPLSGSDDEYGESYRGFPVD